MTKIPRVADLLPLARIEEDILLQNVYGDRNFLVGPDGVIQEIEEMAAMQFYFRARGEGVLLWSEEQRNSRYEKWGREGRPVHPFFKLPRSLDRNWKWWYDGKVPGEKDKKPKSKSKPKPPPIPVAAAKKGKKVAPEDRDWRRELREKLGLDPDGD